MAESVEAGPSVIHNPLDIEQIRSKAQNQWLPHRAICQILQNHKGFHITSAPHDKPPSGSLFLFDRKVQKHFRNDGHNWTKKKDGKQLLEGHRPFKVEGFGNLNCYYARGKENRNFLRRCYWMPERDFSHIVLVHYLEETGRMEEFSCVKGTEGEILQMPNSQIDGSLSSGSRPNNWLELSENTDTGLNSAQPLERENAPSAIPGIDLVPTQSDKGKSDNDAESLSSSSHPDAVDKFLSDSFVRGLDSKEHSQIRAESKGKSGDCSCAEEAQVSVSYSQGQESVEIMPNSNIDSSMCPGSPNNCRVLSVSEYTDTALLTHGAQALEHENAQSEYNHQASFGYHFDPELQQPAAEQIDAGGSDPKVPLFYSNSIHESLSTILDIELDPTQLNIGNSDTDAKLAQLPDDLWTSLDFTILKDDWESFTPCAESIEHGSLPSSSRPDTEGKFVSNNVVKRLDFGGHLQIQEKSKASVEGSSSLSESACDVTSKFHEQEVNHLELMDSVDPQQKHLDLRNNNSKENHFQRSLSNEKAGYVLPLDSDGDLKFEGKSIYSSSIGQHLFDGLLTKQGSKKRSSSGDNGETGENENENDVSSITCEGRLDIQDINAAENYSDSAEANLILRFDKILCSGSSATNPVTSSLEEASQLSSKISSLLKGDNKELDQMLKTGSRTEFSSEKLKDQLLQKHLKEKLHVWILQKVAEGGNGPSILDEDGQGVLHFAAALGYDWALEPTIVAGVSVDFRDVNGWTALHWSAFCGREHTVASLISLGAATRALTHPSPKYPSGSTPADLASINGHKGIAEYLAHCSLDVHISCINLDHQEDLAGPKAVQKISEKSAAQLSLGNASDGQSQKDLSATSSSFLERGLEIPNVRRRHQFSISNVFRHATSGLLGDMIEEISHLLPTARIHEEEDEDEDEEPDDERPDDEGPEGEGPEGEGPEKDEGPEKEKEDGKKRAPDSALESEKACKILKAYSAYMALLTAYYIVQSMETVQVLVLVCVEASKKTGERKLSYIDDGFELSTICEGKESPAE